MGRCCGTMSNRLPLFCDARCPNKRYTIYTDDINGSAAIFSRYFAPKYNSIPAQTTVMRFFENMISHPSPHYFSVLQKNR